MIKKPLYKYSFQSTKKLALVLATFTLMINASKKADLLLKRILCIYHLVYFKKIKDKIQILLNFRSKINIMTQAYIAKLGFMV